VLEMHEDFSWTQCLILVDGNVQIEQAASSSYGWRRLEGGDWRIARVDSDRCCQV